MLGTSVHRSDTGFSGAARCFASPTRDEHEVGLSLRGRCARLGGEVIVGDMGDAGRAVAAALVEVQGHASVKDACETWTASRIDAADSTRVLHRVALGRGRVWRPRAGCWATRT